MATCLTDAEETIVANVGFSSGKHYWEITCPAGSNGVQVGVIKEGWSFTSNVSSSAAGFYFSAKSAHPRTFGVSINFADKKINYYINGQIQSNRKQDIPNPPPGAQQTPIRYFPAVKIKEIGTQVILNPFAQEPGSQRASFDYYSITLPSAFKPGPAPPSEKVELV